ncbi:acyl-CoA synthetase [Amycolatopsis regifaucium]|uniref:Acyl-CoA synthetase n=1 Tax=Amycolatopsis regifaucium TaxID=546365 RepID=A0A154MBI3_9PSEU|nr:acyl-CoA synthetase [Amycolatopsis regifaucium]OKA06044.1 acyl-CoA synthetase [Amycolatopsis regifaucium]SFG75561.1 long-chain acyl-CoA synthetase [Amycolatopsis regifaucium]
MSAEQVAEGSVPTLLAEAARQWPGKTAVQETGGGVTLTWAELDNAAHTLARALLDAGIDRGDRVALRLPTSAAFAVSLFGALRAGATVVPISPQAPVAELNGLLEHSGARLLLEREPTEELFDGVTSLSPPITSDGAVGPVDAAGAGEDIAVISYTSGTTGPPRGVMLSHRALLANLDQLSRIVPTPLVHGDRVLITIPLFHVYGLGPGLLQTTSVGATAILSERFLAERTLADCAEYRVTSIAGVPAMYAEFAAMDPDELGAGLSSIRRMTSGAAPLHPKILAAIRGATGLDVYEGYGLTECAPVVTTTLVTGYPKPGSVGRPLPGIELRLVDSDGDATPVPLDPDDLGDAFDEDGGTGLVSIRGANLFSGYWPDGAHGPDEEGWFRTGDVGYLDTDGDLHLVDRANDLIIVNGFNVYPHEVENVISMLDEVVEAGVVGVVDERTGEAVKAVVVPAPGASLSEQQVVEHCAEHLAGYKVPHTVEFAESLPHSATGKLRRLRLR